MADLLECLIQIKGVADTPRRLGVRLAALSHVSDPEVRGRATDLVRRMAECEVAFARILALMLADDCPAVPRLPSASSPGSEGSVGHADWEGVFSTRRAVTVAVLEQCSAEQLNRIGVEPSRGPMTVADLVALMLSHDTDCLGDLSRAGVTPA